MKKLPILYMNTSSPPARSVLMLIDILGLEFDLQTLNPVLREQDEPEMKKKNPMRTIPILDDNGFSLADSHAIVVYLMGKYGKPEHSYLYPPNDIKKRATINQRLYLDCGILFPRLRAIMAPTYAGRLIEISKYMKINIEDAYTMLEDYLSETLYLADEVITLADICIITTVSALHGLHPVNEKRYPKLMQWLNNMSKQDYCKRINKPGCEDHVIGLKLMIENNKHNLKSKI